MSTTRFTDELKAAAGDQWNRIIHHKFTTQLAANTIDRRVLTKYLVQDFRFLDAFCVLLGSIVAHARCLEDRIPACQFLGLVSSKENTYFERCFTKLVPKYNAMSGSDESLVTATPDEACTTGFCNLMREVALQGSLAEMLSVICVCEWTYLSWANVVKDAAVRQDFETYEWIDLHSGDDFEQVVAYFRRLLDKEGETMNAEERATCEKRFLQAMQLEEDFFDMAYS